MCNCWPEGIKYLYGKAVQYGPCTLSQRPKYFKVCSQCVVGIRTHRIYQLDRRESACR